MLRELPVLTFALMLMPGLAAAEFPDAHESAPTDWHGPVFKLSQAYPTVRPNVEPYPWKGFDYVTQPEQYIRAVFSYVLKGNAEVDWVVQNNTVRKWYHAPWMHWSDSGREFVHGLTRERTTPVPAAGQAGELGPGQTKCFQNWAVGFFNAPGGYTVGQVWADPFSPDAAKARFLDGTVVAKLLFTAATVDQAPYLANAFEWDANVSDIADTDTGCREHVKRRVQKMRLLQIDLAVRDERADGTTGWVFGTYSYDGNASGATVWDRMIPVGVMWGNDPTLTPDAFNQNARVQETWINPAINTPQHLGWLGRLNGPVDNPRSSCLSCHGAAQVPSSSPMLFPASTPDFAKMRWFRNVHAGATLRSRLGLHRLRAAAIHGHSEF